MSAARLIRGSLDLHSGADQTLYSAGPAFQNDS